MCNHCSLCRFVWTYQSFFCFFFFFFFLSIFFFFFFFFQAEDGIRDGTVTGVQTCALPISRDPTGLGRPRRRPRRRSRPVRRADCRGTPARPARSRRETRSRNRDSSRRSEEVV